MKQTRRLNTNCFAKGMDYVTAIGVSNLVMERVPRQQQQQKKYLKFKITAS
jgi:hypothetical protein